MLYSYCYHYATIITIILIFIILCYLWRVPCIRDALYCLAARGRSGNATSANTQTNNITHIYIYIYIYMRIYDYSIVSYSILYQTIK